MRQRELSRGPAAVLLAAIGLVACSHRAPVGSGQDGAPLDLGGSPTIDGGIATEPDRGSGPSPCTCLVWSPIGYSCSFDFDWGCKEHPQHFGVADLPDPCLKVVTDPNTGCKMPLMDPGCTESCYPPPPPSPPASVIGRPCTQDGGECGVGASCLLTDPLRGGVCAFPCRPDDPKTKLVNEDNCPDLSIHACATIPLNTGDKISVCVQTCDPKHGANDCASPLACRAVPRAISGLDRRAVCLFFGCQSGADCPVYTERPCTPGSPTTCGPAERCRPSSPGAKKGFCVRDGTCDLASGLCAPRTQNFSKTAKVGDPCTSDLNCGANQRCEREADLAVTKKPSGATCFDASQCCSSVCASGKCAAGLCPVHARNGYCVVEGCAFKTLTAYHCPPGSTCNRLFPGGLCQRECDLKDKGGCRNHPGDKLGDYECRAWDHISSHGRPIADAPVCDFGDQLRCNSYAQLNCDSFGLLGNATHMTCRNMKGSALPNPRSSQGLCLDDTSSGPAAP